MRSDETLVVVPFFFLFAKAMNTRGKRSGTIDALSRCFRVTRRNHLEAFSIRSLRKQP